MKTKIAVFVSGGGTNLQALIDAEAAGKIPDGEIVLVLSSKKDAYALKRAEKASIATAVVSKKECKDGAEFEKAILCELEKHGIEMGFSSAEAYEDAAEAVVQNSSVLHKMEAEDGDDVYYLQESNEFVVVSPDGYIRTYFCPEDGIEYYNRQ
jgi:pyocin large subunit-like protein